MSDPKLWMLHIQGPDDIVAAPSKEQADRVAEAFNAFHGEYANKRRAEIAASGGDPDNWPNVTAVVVEWAGGPSEHAESVTNYWPDYAAYFAPSDGNCPA
uniref:Uncharacterized protein n=1 Tax=Burkholderia sp. M701 TaxID=326454 RepID=V5YNP2_9BURK|nr:hypothetical protein [Burkholderia sp. M701]BAO18879.1 hypothetical protein [Burkholderia sp. M701]